MRCIVADIRQGLIEVEHNENGTRYLYDLFILLDTLTCELRALNRSTSLIVSYKIRETNKYCRYETVLNQELYEATRI